MVIKILFKEEFLKLGGRLKKFEFPTTSLKNSLSYLMYTSVTLFHVCTVYIPCILYKTVFVQFIMTNLKRNQFTCQSKYLTECVSDFGEILDSNDTIFADCEFYSKKGNKESVSVSVLQLNGPISLDQMEKLLEKNFPQQQTNSKATSTLEKLQCYPFIWVGYWIWKRDVAFKIKNHVEELTYFGQKWNTKMLGRLHQKLLNDEFPENRSPWKVTLVQKSVRPNEIKTIVCLRLHQCLGNPDNVTRFILKCLQTDPVPNETPSCKKIIKTGKKGQIKLPLFLRAFSLNVTLLVYQRQCQNHPWYLINQKNWRSSVVRFSGNIPLDYIKLIAGMHGNVQISAVLVNAIITAMENFIPVNIPACPGNNTPVLLTVFDEDGTQSSVIINTSVRRAEVALIEEVEEVCASTRIKYYDDLISQSVDTEVLQEMINIGAYLTRPFRFSKLPLLHTFPISITIFCGGGGDAEDDHDECGSNNDEISSEKKKNIPKNLFIGSVQCYDMSTCTTHAVLPGNSAGVSFNAYCFQGHVRFCVVANSTVLSEEQCEKVVKLLENEILRSWAWSTIPQ